MALPVVLEPVSSSAVAELGYLAEQRTLLVRFVGNESVYAYFGVSAQRYRALRSAASIGRYLNRHILRDYPVARLTGGHTDDPAPAAVPADH
jgi:hypothetical protein